MARWPWKLLLQGLPGKIRVRAVRKSHVVSIETVLVYAKALGMQVLQVSGICRSISQLIEDNVHVCYPRPRLSATGLQEAPAVNKVISWEILFHMSTISLNLNAPKLLISRKTVFSLALQRHTGEIRRVPRMKWGRHGTHLSH